MFHKCQYFCCKIEQSKPNQFKSTSMMGVIENCPQGQEGHIHIYNNSMQWGRGIITFWYQYTLCHRPTNQQSRYLQSLSRNIQQFLPSFAESLQCLIFLPYILITKLSSKYLAITLHDAPLPCILIETQCYYLAQYCT